MVNLTHYSAILSSPIGMLGIIVQHEHLTHIDYLPANTKSKRPCDALSTEVITQLKQYFKQPQYHFDLPLQLHVSPFQRRVLNALCNIPVGCTQSYGTIAATLNTSPRPIGMACRHNPIPIIIPCHRVVAAQHLGGYNGATTGTMMTVKRWLLQHEAAVIY